MAGRMIVMLALGALATAGVASAAPAAWASPVAAPARLSADVDVDSAVNLAGPGLIRVAVLTTGALDAADVDPATIVVGDGTGPGAPVARQPDGRLVASMADTDGDGRDDLVVHVDKRRLVADGALDADTAALAVAGELRDGRALRGADTVDPEVALEVKFREALEVRGADERLVSRAGEGLRRVRAVLERHRAQSLTPLVRSVTARQLGGLTAAARSRSGRVAPDMASWYRLTLPAAVDAEDVLAKLRSLPEVAHAYPAPEPAPPPQSTTPDFTGMQGYLRPAPAGIDNDFSHRDPRTRGAGIRVVDLEYDWNPFHEDLGLDWSTDLGGDVFPRYTGFADEHGTAVFGELVAAENEYGVTGGVPDAQMLGISPTRRVSPTQTRWLPSEAMVYAAQFLDPGDALLIEQQTVGPNGGTRYVPIEWMQSAFDATRLLSDLGITVVATGGNGGENLDAPEFLGRFDRDVRDSGAILVGAGSSTTHARLTFSVYGSRVDLQGWGQTITTTGGNGNLQGGTDPANRHVRYTRSFGGTSGAGPIVTSAVVAIQSYREATGQEPWSAARIADLLRRTGTPQGGDTSQHIGPLPDVRAALMEIEVDPPTTTATLDQRPPRIGDLYVNPTMTLEAEDGWGRGIDSIRYRVDGRPWKTYERPFRVLGPGEHSVRYYAIDRNGNVEAVQTLTFRNIGN